jgi:ketosteroid isomerase-like protein
MAEAQAVPSVENFFSAWSEAINARDAAGAASLCSEDVIWDDSALVRGQTLHGRAAVCDFLEQYLFRPIPDLRFEILELLWAEDGTKAAERARLSGTFLSPIAPLNFAPTGKPIVIEVAGFFHFRESRAHQVRIILDMLNIARQTGAAPSVGTFTDHLITMLQHVKAFRLRRRQTGAK